ncbi:hypothetical protein [Nocardia otitidiscaviarum]|uniref:hypothetical protein n=1 Tax=Nocardia otitidiscaviarum TaxID=1823 RepID=UPI001894F45D|nr:hypothetical protein [Nocardia otitidiscaviarum]MBF6237361.1 hypothetical protein [Nocardia otitidiscaviarum]
MVNPDGVTPAGFRSPPLHTTFVCDNTTMRRLVWVDTLMLWRKSTLWLLIVGVGVLGAGTRWANDEGEFDIPGMMGAGAIFVAFTLFLIGVTSLWRLLAGRGGSADYARPGTQITASYDRDTADLRIPFQPSFRNLPYHQIKRLHVFDAVVYLRKRDSQGIAIPRELAPEPALALMRAAGVRM